MRSATIQDYEFSSKSPRSLAMLSSGGGGEENNWYVDC